MIEKNVEFLKQSLLYLGFGEKMNVDLENTIKQGPTEFKLFTTGEFSKYNINENVKYTLDFKKSDRSEMYFLNKYEATLKNDDPEKERSQTFYIGKDSNYTAKEAYNLLSGRAVHKELTNREGEKYTAWVQLDFQVKDKNNNFKVDMYHQNYGYELVNALSKYPIKELASEQDNLKLLKSLEKGNLQQVTFVREGNKEEKMFIEANPQYKNITVYDAKMQKVFQGVDKKEKQEPEKSKEQKETLRKDKDEEDPAQKEKKSKRKGVRV